MALNPTFASASVNPSQSMGSDVSAPAQGSLPMAMPAQQNTIFGQQGVTGMGQSPIGGLSYSDSLDAQKFNSLTNDQKIQQYQQQLQQLQQSPSEVAPRDLISGMTPRNFEGNSLMGGMPSMLQDEIGRLQDPNYQQPFNVQNSIYYTPPNAQSDNMSMLGQQPQAMQTQATQTSLNPIGATNMATNPLSTYATTPTTGSTPAPNLGVTPGSASSGSFGQGGVLPNVTTTQQQVTAAPTFYTDYLNQLATQGGQASQNAQYVGAQPLQEQAFNQASQNVGNYQPTLQNAINLASSVGNTNLAQAIGDVGQANIARNLAPQATAGIVGSGQFGSKRGAQALGDVIANAELGLTAQQQQAMQQDMANRIAAAQQLGTLANTTQQLGLGDVNALSTLGQQQQTIAQNEQLFPMQQLANQSALLRGYTIPTSVSASQTGPGQAGQFQTSPLQQLMSVGTLLGALAKPDASGKSAGGNLYGGLESLINKITGKFSSPTVNPSTNTTTSTSIGDVSSSIKTLPDGRPNPNYDAYADPNATDADRELQNLLNTTPNPDLDILDYSDNSSIADEFDYSGFRE